MADTGNQGSGQKAAGDPYPRDESAAERLDRNWAEMLQELRVTQTGTQILTGFLLTLAFTERFTELDQYQLNVYLALVVLAALATGFGLAPVTLHRSLFRRHAKDSIVMIAHVLLRSTLACVGLLLSGVALFIFDVVLGRTAGIVAGSGAFVVAVLLWMLVPLAARSARNRSDS